MCGSNILMYHNISLHFEFSFRSVSRSLFEKHINVLLNNGIRFFSREQIMQGQIMNTSDFVLITFDDAYEGVYNFAFPVMERYSITGAVFISAGYVGKLNTWDFSPIRHLRHMDKKMLINLSKNGWLIGSHGFNHVDLRKCSKENLKMEICDSKKKIEDIIADEVILFAYPFGLFNKRALDTVKECGYKYAFATANGVSHNRFMLKRMAVYFIDPTPLPLLSGKYHSLYSLRNRVISSCASLTPLYIRLFRVSRIKR